MFLSPNFFGNLCYSDIVLQIRKTEPFHPLHCVPDQEAIALPSHVQVL